LPESPANSVQIGTERVLEGFFVGEAYWKNAWASILRLGQMIRRGNLFDHHLTVNRFSRQKGDEKISLVYLRLNTLSPADAYRDDLVNENVVVLAQCLADRLGD
jgi:hypothetical protein